MSQLHIIGSIGIPELVLEYSKWPINIRYMLEDSENEKNSSLKISPGIKDALYDDWKKLGAENLPEKLKQMAE